LRDKRSSSSWIIFLVIIILTGLVFLLFGGCAVNRPLIKKTTEIKYDSDGNIVSKIIKEEEVVDSSKIRRFSSYNNYGNYYRSYRSYPSYPYYGSYGYYRSYPYYRYYGYGYSSRRVSYPMRYDVTTRRSARSSRSRGRR